jgi:hypothetical protein
VLVVLGQQAILLEQAALVLLFIPLHHRAVAVAVVAVIALTQQLVALVVEAVLV